MKKFLLIALCALYIYNANAQVGVSINDAVASPNSHAILDIDVSNNNKGILIPRLTSTQRTNISGLTTSETGLTVFDETTSSYWYWNGSSWINMDSDWKLTGNSGTSTSNFIGTTDNQYFKIKTNNTLRLTVDNNANNIGIGSDLSGGDPQNNIEIRETFGDIRISSFNSYTWDKGPELILQRSRGSVSSPSTLKSGDYLGQICFMGGNNSNVSGTIAASIKSISGSDWNTTRSADLRFYTENYPSSTSGTSPLERMIITKDGNVGIGTSNPAGKLEVNGEIKTSNDVNGMLTLGRCDNSSEGGQINFTGAGSYPSFYEDIAGNEFRVFTNSSSTVTVHMFNIGSGNTNLSIDGQAYKPGGGSWAVSSDRRSKENIINYNKGLKELLQLRPVNFNYRKEFNWGSKTYTGLIAQELEKVVPTMVETRPTNGIQDFKVIDPNELTYMLINAVKELKAENDNLKNTNKKILERLKKLENKLE